MTDIADHRIFLVQTSVDDIGLPTYDHVVGMVDKGVAEQVSGATAGESGLDAKRRRIELEMLNRAAVGNGTKAISIFLHASWTQDLIEAFGRFDEPATIKRWRTASRKAAEAESSGGEHDK